MTGFIDADGAKRYVSEDFTRVQGKSGERPVRTRHCIRDVEPGSQVAWAVVTSLVGTRYIPEEARR